MVPEDDTTVLHESGQALLLPGLIVNVRSVSFCLKSAYHGVYDGSHVEHGTLSSTAFLPSEIGSPGWRAQFSHDHHAVSALLPLTQAACLL